MQLPVASGILGGKYRLIRQLGRGGMGSVWYAEHLSLKSPVAVKLIDPEIATSPEALARFLREAQAAASLRSPHVVQILDHGVDAGIPYIVMELLEGESLADRVTRLGRLSPADASHILTQVCRAVGRAHEGGIVHRDLKPDNIFIVQNDEEEVAKVLDFGIAKAISNAVSAPMTGATRTGSVLGTPYYMSPEQAEGSKHLDHRTDIWSIGVIACECLTGRRPFDADTLGGILLDICARPMPIPSQLGPVPAGFDAWFSRACARDQNQRFATAKEAAAELRRVCAGQPMTAPLPPSSGAPTQFMDAPLPATSSGFENSSGGLSATMKGKSGDDQGGSQRRSSWLLPALFAVIGVLVLATGALVYRMRSEASSTAIATSSPSEASSSSLAPASAHGVAVEPPMARPEVVARPSVLPASAEPVLEPSASSAPPAPPPRAPKRPAPKPARPGAAALPERPAPERPAPAPERPSATPDPKVNLGI